RSNLAAPEQPGYVQYLLWANSCVLPWLQAARALLYSRAPELISLRSLSTASSYRYLLWPTTGCGCERSHTERSPELDLASLALAVLYGAHGGSAQRGYFLLEGVADKRGPFASRPITATTAEHSVKQRGGCQDSS